MLGHEEDGEMTFTQEVGWWHPARLLGRSAEERKALELTLGNDSTWSTRVPRAGVEVRCLEGMVLVTAEGDVEDHVLTAGAVLIARRRGRLAVWALEDARVRVDGAPRDASPAIPRRRRATPAILEPRALARASTPESKRGAS
jgi:DUF2917 family protein